MADEERVEQANHEVPSYIVNFNRALKALEILAKPNLDAAVCQNEVPFVVRADSSHNTLIGSDNIDQDYYKSALVCLYELTEHPTENELRNVLRKVSKILASLRDNRVEGFIQRLDNLRLPQMERQTVANPPLRCIAANMCVAFNASKPRSPCFLERTYLFFTTPSKPTVRFSPAGEETKPANTSCYNLNNFLFTMFTAVLFLFSPLIIPLRYIADALAEATGNLDLFASCRSVSTPGLGT